MVRTSLTPVVFASSGAAPAPVAGDNTNGMQFAYSPRRVLQVKNTTGAPINVTVPIAATVDGKTVSSQVVAVPATTGERFIGPLSSAYAQADANVYVDFAATGCTVTLFDLPAVS